MENIIFIEANKFIFPYGSKIVLYGADDLENAYLCQLKQNGYCLVVAVADMKFEKWVKIKQEGKNLASYF